MVDQVRAQVYHEDWKKLISQVWVYHFVWASLPWRLKEIDFSKWLIKWLIKWELKSTMKIERNWFLKKSKWLDLSTIFDESHMKLSLPFLLNMFIRFVYQSTILCEQVYHEDWKKLISQSVRFVYHFQNCVCEQVYHEDWKKLIYIIPHELPGECCAQYCCSADATDALLLCWCYWCSTDNDVLTKRCY